MCSLLLFQQLLVSLTVQLHTTKSGGSDTHPDLVSIKGKLQVEHGVGVECKVGEPLVNINVRVDLLELDFFEQLKVTWIFVMSGAQQVDAAQ